MKFIETKIPGCFEIIPDIHRDVRGLFVKTFLKKIFQEYQLNTQWEEEYFSVSRKGVLRGLHFQLPPQNHSKLVYCVAGEAFDAVVDLRQGSPTFGRNVTLKISASKSNMLYIPSGLAHGFYTLSDTLIMMYKASTSYSPPHDTGIMWNSAGINWPSQNPILSSRDSSFTKLESFKTPFNFEQIILKTA